MRRNDEGLLPVWVAPGVPWDDARIRARCAGTRLPSMPVTLAGALGRILAAPLIAQYELPGFDSAAMDGYAVRGGPPWKVVGATRAGACSPSSLASGCAWEVATGAPVPHDADAVIPYECTERRGHLVSGAGGKRNIRRAGEEARTGDAVVHPGSKVTPSVQALAAALGYDEILVRQQPRVAALMTGDELVRRGRAGPGQVRDAIGPALSGVVADAGAVLVLMSYVPDRRAALVAALAGAEADLIIVTGSSSAGPADHLRTCLGGLGAVPIVPRVACRPGQTQSLWRMRDRRLVVGMPGNPFAAFASFFTLVVPICAGLLGADLPALRPVPRGEVRSDRARTRLVPVKDRSPRIEPVPFDGSAMLRGLAVADAIAVVPPAAQPDDLVGLLPLAR